MSIAIVSYSDCPSPVFIQQRPKTDCVDIWLRKNITSREESQDQSEDTYTVWEADEAYMYLPAVDAPTTEEALADFDGWFAKAEVWEPADEDEATLDVRVDELEEALYMILRGETEDAT